MRARVGLYGGPEAKMAQKEHSPEGEAVDSWWFKTRHQALAVELEYPRKLVATQESKFIS